MLGRVTRGRVALVAIAGIALTSGVGIAAIPSEDDGTIRACHGASNGQLRVIDADAGAACKAGERALQWNQRGPQGQTGPAGPQGEMGPAGPGALVATGLVSPDGGIFPQFVQGPVPTITHLGPGHYGLEITGFGTTCPLPSLQPYGTSSEIHYFGGECGPGVLRTEVFVEGGVDRSWSYTLLGTPAPSGAGASAARAEADADRTASLPGSAR